MHNKAREGTKRQKIPKKRDENHGQTGFGEAAFGLVGEAAKKKEVGIAEGGGMLRKSYADPQSSAGVRKKYTTKRQRGRRRSCRSGESETAHMRGGLHG